MKTEYTVIRKTEDTGAESKSSANRNTLDHLIGHELATMVNKMSENCDFHFTLRLVTDLETLEVKRNTSEGNNYGFGPIHIEGKGYGKAVGMVGNPPDAVRVQFKDGKEKGFTGEVRDYHPEKLRKLNTCSPLF